MNLKNKHKLLKFTLLLFFIGSVGATAANAADTPEQAAKSFYNWYLKEITANANPGKQKATFQKYVSNRLSKWYYSSAYEEYGADYFIDAQDFDDNWQVTTGKAAIKGNTATLKVTLALPNAKKDDWGSKLTVKMVKEAGVWKIDMVNDQKLIV